MDGPLLGMRQSNLHLWRVKAWASRNVSRIASVPLATWKRRAAASPLHWQLEKGPHHWDKWRPVDMRMSCGGPGRNCFEPTIG